MVCMLVRILMAFSLAVAASAATVTGTFKLADGTAYTSTVTFRPVSSPSMAGADVVTGADIKLTPTSQGYVSTSLSAGYYSVYLGSTRRFTIAVPSGSGTVDVTSILTTPAWFVPGEAGASGIVTNTYATATTNAFGTVRIDTASTNPVVYLKESVDALVAPLGARINGIQLVSSEAALSTTDPTNGYAARVFTGTTSADWVWNAVEGGADVSGERVRPTNYVTGSWIKTTAWATSKSLGANRAAALDSSGQLTASSATKQQVDKAAMQVASKAALVALTTNLTSGVVAVVGASSSDAELWSWNSSSTASTNVDVLALTAGGTGRWERIRSSSTPLRQTGYIVYEPTVSNSFILNVASSGYQYNHDSSLAYYGGTWFAQWNANTNQYESNPGQVNLQSTSTDFVTWTAPVPVFVDAATSSNPVTYSWSSDLQWQPNLVNVGSELWSIWSQQLPLTYPTGQRIYFSRLTSPTGKWANTLLSLNYTENGMTFYGFPTQNPIVLQSGRVLAPLIWMATNVVSPTPSGWTTSDTFWVNEKRAGVIYTDDGGTTWKVGGVTTLPGARHSVWEPVVQQAPDGSIRLYCRNLDYKNYGYSQYMLTAAGFSDGLVFGPLQVTTLDTTSSRYGLAAQAGKFPRQLGFANDWKSGGFVSDRYNGALTVSRFGMDDFVFGPSFSGSEQVISYPQAVVTDSDIRVIYSQGSVPRSIKTALISPLPDASRLYLMPRRNDYVNPQVAYRTGPPAYFEHGANSVMSSTASSASWASGTQFSFGAWLYRTNNPASEAYVDFRNLSYFSGAAVVSATGVPRVVVYNGTSPVNVDFNTLSLPTAGWCYLGVSVDTGSGSATAYVVNSGGTATTQTVSFTATNLLNGSTFYVGGAQPGSTIAKFAGAIRHVVVQNGVVATANNHRYWHGLDQSALSVSDWSATETSPGTLSMDYWAGDSNAGSNNATWLASWSSTGESVRGNAFSATVGSDLVLTVTGTGSAGVELFPFTPGQQLVFGTQVLLTNKTSGYDQVIASIGGKSNRIDILSRDANSTKIEAYHAETGAFYELATYVSGTYLPLTLVFDGNLVFVSVGTGSEVQIPVTFKSPRLYLGTGYLDTWSVDATQGKNYLLGATYCHVGTAVPYVSLARSAASYSAIGSQPFVALIDTDTTPPRTNFIYQLGANLRIGGTNQASSAPFLFQQDAGSLTVSGPVTAGSTITAPDGIIRKYAATPQFDFRRSNGSADSPSTVASGDFLGALYGGGYDGTSETTARAALIYEATQTWSSGANGTKVYIMTTPNGSATRAKVWEWGSDGNVLMTNTAPVLQMGAANGTSGARIQVFGHSSQFFRLLDDAATTRFSIEPSTWNVVVYGSKVTLGGASGPTITTGSAAPSASEPNGSIYLRTGGSPYFYVREAGSWVGK